MDKMGGLVGGSGVSGKCEVEGKGGVGRGKVMVFKICLLPLQRSHPTGGDFSMLFRRVPLQIYKNVGFYNIFPVNIHGRLDKYMSEPRQILRDTRDPRGEDVPQVHRVELN